MGRCVIWVEAWTTIIQNVTEKQDFAYDVIS